MIYKGDVYYANLNPVIGSEQGGVRPVLVLQNNAGNKHSSTVIIAPITRSRKRNYLPTHVILPETGELPYPSVVLLEQIRVVDKKRLREFVTHMETCDMNEINAGIIESFGLSHRQDSKKTAGRLLGGGGHHEKHSVSDD